MKNKIKDLRIKIDGLSQLVKGLKRKNIRWYIYKWFNSDNFAVLFLICAWIAAITIYIYMVMFN